MLGMGSFAALPVVRAAVKCRIPLFLHDGNARIGKANRFFSSQAKFTATAFPAVNAAACRSKVIETGMPLRPELREFAGISKSEAIDEINREFGTEFTAGLPLILITGGSQGAAVFNESIPPSLMELPGKFQVIHLTGKGKIDGTQELYRQARFPLLLLESTGKMALLLAAADLVFSRSGGSTAAELSLFGKASVLVPYPYAAEGHQTDNAGYFESHEAAKMVANSEFDTGTVNALLDDFFSHRDRWEQMGKAMRELAIPDAAAKMVAEISDALD
jgi:UDP-N-acetylglucosamine--N-acetylmuramyl-(pentapeptide) pyrophosphoryl-undecaprenol N-acetylglucosamine transferase